MIQDIAPRRLINHYDPAAKPDAESFVLRFHGSKLLARVEGEVSFPRLGELGHASALTYLLSVDGERCFLADEDPDAPEGYDYVEIRSLRGADVGPKHRVFAALTCKHLSDWYRDNRFCGRCGAPMRHSETERAMTCPACGFASYPRIMPAVIVGVRNGDSLLLTHYRAGYRHNALIAGFTEIGETLEQTVEREVMEETGLCVKNIRYYKSQPWGIANDILMGFYCDVDGDPTIHMDEAELSVAVWTKREDIVLQPDEFSLTNEMMAMFKEGKA